MATSRSGPTGPYADAGFAASAGTEAPMNGQSMLERDAADRAARGHDRTEHQPFLATYRAVAACAREFTRMSEDVVRGLRALAAAGIADVPVVRQSPDRCLVQLGPVALSLAWLRGAQDSVADGELLVVLWRGAIARRAGYTPARGSAERATLTATELWSEVLAPEAASESEWQWRGKTTGFSSSELATAIVERLRDAHGAGPSS